MKMNMSRLIKYFINLLLLVNIAYSQSSSAAEIYLEKSEVRSGQNKFLNCITNINFSGEIVKGDALKLEDFYKRLRSDLPAQGCGPGLPTIMIDSTGGDLDEAIKIGRYIRKNLMGTTVSWMHNSTPRTKGKCFSACIFILAGGVKRQVIDEFSQIGIHRPYFVRSTGSDSVDEIRKIRKNLSEKMYLYFDEMDINPSLVEDMMAASPSEIRILTENEGKKYRLTVDDANHEEAEVLRAAKRFGLSTAEYRKRDVEANKLCEFGIGKPYVSCWTAHVLGVSVQDFEKRRRDANIECGAKLNEHDKNYCIEQAIFRRR
jgi:hypothetical protein